VGLAVAENGYENERGHGKPPGRVWVRENPRLARDYEQAETDGESVNVGHRHHESDHTAGLSQPPGCFP